MSASWLDEALAWRKEGERFVLVTVLAVRGSAPCEPGRRMLVAASRQGGTVGGGRLEQEVTEQARAMLEGRADNLPAMESLTLGARLGQCCGGKVIVHYEMMQEALPTVAVFGAGHVGQELARVLSRLPNPLVVVDSRRQWLSRLPDGKGIEVVHEPDPVDAVADLPQGSVCVVLTHRHDLDLEVCRGLLKRGDMKMVGVIGSRSKAARFRREIAARGLRADDLVCPVGSQAGKHPASVAISMAAKVCQVLADGEDGAAGHSKQAQKMIDELAEASSDWI